MASQDHDDTDLLSHQQEQELLDEFARREKARSIAVPTNDLQVKARLRELREPICLFAEGPMDRRSRLRYLLSKLSDEELQNLGFDREEEAGTSSGSDHSDDEQTEEFYTEGSEGLLKARQRIAEYSLARAQARIEREHAEHDIPVLTTKNHRNRINQRLQVQTIVVIAGYSGPPLSCIVLAEVPQCNIQMTFKGDYLATTSFDTTWRLWDTATQQELLLQEGHSKEVFGLAIHPDGSLVATGGFDGIGKLWDLRTGRSIFDLTGHVKEIYQLDFSPNGYHMASGSADNTVRIFDLRAMKCLTMLAAHKSLVSGLAFYQGPLDTDHGPATTMDIDTDEPRRPTQLSSAGTYLVSSSYDGTIKVWSADDWRLVTTLPDHGNKVMSVDIARDGQYIASCGFDKTFKLWGADE
ncbi:hypothetical protein H4R34_003096 [Dimargaris verticillata]|uniref:Pre-mRNA processing factor 4 (PRP4)-like domain-containing protein n=1 Tax=Dimargaris verticillata TaxID=2761393 RepID=A0A9W8B6W5_9FUNG|nr:hypothetical protein H4R34_003096 [Dimargaris verticillata]